MKKILIGLLLLQGLTACHVGRYFVYNFANITDHKIFPAQEMAASPTPLPFVTTATEDPRIASIKISTKKRSQLGLTQFLDEETRTTAFLVIKNDSILYEQYFEGYGPDQISTFFSVSKSITSILVGIAVEEGLIASIDDPVTKYIPELLDADPGFQRQTIRHLLMMRSGLQYRESYTSPFAPMAKLYYGQNQLGQIKKMKFREEPGTVHRYQSVSTAILGIVIEKAAGKNLGQYMEEKLWQPLGTEYDASFSLDDKRHRSAKAYSGVNATARDLAKIGRLFLNGGQANGQQIVSADWVNRSITPNPDNDFYQYQWYSSSKYLRNEDKEALRFADSTAAKNTASAAGYPNHFLSRSRTSGQYYVKVAEDEFYAQGILNQFLYVDPSENLIIVRLGKKWDVGYLWLFPRIRDRLMEGR